jgi:hypothetical protein
MVVSIDQKYNYFVEVGRTINKDHRLSLESSAPNFENKSYDQSWISKI